MTDLSAELSRVLKYRWDRKEEGYPYVSDPDDTAAHHAFGDLLQGMDDPKDRDLGVKIAEELRRTPGPSTNRTFGPRSATPDLVLGRVRLNHPNPTVRAMARQIPVGFPASKDIIDLLFHSDHTTRPHDHDLAVYLAPDDDAHSINSTLSHVNGGTHPRQVGGELVPGHNLSAKVVRGTVYLLDHGHTDRPFGAPAIVFDAPANDRDEVKALRDHADAVARQRHEEAAAAAVTGPAHIGPVSFAS